MPFPIKYEIPEKYFIIEKTRPYTSSTVGAFSAQRAIEGNQGFQGRMFPDPQCDNRKKKALIINYCPQHVDYYYVISHMLDQKFSIYLFYQGKPVLLSDFPIADYDFDRGMDHQKASDALVAACADSAEPLRADHILICDFEEMKELRNIVGEIVVSNVVDTNAFTDMVITQWLQTKTLPKGKGYPLIDADETFIEAMGREGLLALRDSSIELAFSLSSEEIEESIQQLCMHLAEKIKNFSISNKYISSIQECLDFSHIKKMTLTVVDESNNLGKEILYLLRKVRNLEDLEIYTSISGNHFFDENAIKSLPNLKTLSLRGVNFNNLSLPEHFWGEILELGLDETESGTISLSDILNKTKKLRKLYLGYELKMSKDTEEKINNLDDLSEIDIVSSNDIVGILFPAASQVKTLSFNWRGASSLASILAGTRMQALCSLNLSNSCLKEEDLIAALKLSRKLKILNLSSVTVKENDTQLSWDGICLDKMKDLNLSYANIPRVILKKLFDVAHKIEVLNVSEFRGALPDVMLEYTFKNLKYIKACNHHESNSEIGVQNSVVIHEILLRAKKLKYLNLYGYKRFNLARLAEVNLCFEHLEELNLSGLNITLNELSIIRGNMPNLKVLKLEYSKISGAEYSGPYKKSELLMESQNTFVDGDADKWNERIDSLGKKQDLMRNKLISIDCWNAKIDSVEFFQKSILQYSKPISMSMWLQKKEFLINQYYHKTFLINVCLDSTPAEFWFQCKNISSKYNINSLSISNVDLGNDININQQKLMLSSVTNLLIHSMSTDLTDILHESVIKLISIMTNLQHLAIWPKASSQELVDLIKNGKFIHEKSLLRQIWAVNRKLDENRANSVVRSPVSIGQALNEIVELGRQEEGQVYDEAGVSLADMSTRMVTESDPTYKLQPIFALVSGPDLNIENIRKWTYKPAYNFHDNSIGKIVIKPVLKPYIMDASTQSNASVYKRHPYQLSINPPNNDIKAPWIKLDSLMAYDKLLSVAIMGVMPGDYQIYHSDPDGFYYICFNNDRQNSVMLSYEIAPEKKTFKQYPDAIAMIFEPFKRNYTEKPPISFDTLSLIDQIEAVLTNPEYHACGVRTNAFLYRMHLLHLKYIIHDYRYGGSLYHSWAEILRDGVWYTVDLGGAPAGIEYEPLPQNMNNNAYSSSPLLAPPVSEVVDRFNVSTIEELNNCLTNDKQNNTILLICKDQEHLLEMRRYIRSLEVEKTTVIDTPKDADASSRYLTWNKVEKTWDIVEPKGSEGWLKKRLTQIGEAKQERLLIDWSLFIASEAVSVNTCIDKENRSIDGVPIDEFVQVVGLITVAHELHEDSSFIDRHKGQIWTLSCAPPKRMEEKLVDQAKGIDLYHSEEWQDLLLGKLGFTNGEATHQEGPLLDSKSVIPKKLVLKNPPEDCPEFSRFIQDLEEGRPFKYYDNSLCLPKVVIHIIQDEHKIDRTKIASINVNVTYDELCHAPIEQVLTPSTFERCIVSNRISEDERLFTEKGWLKKEYARCFFVTQALSQEQYACLLDNTTQPLRLYFAPGVPLPEGMEGFKSCAEIVYKDFKKSNSEIFVSKSGPAFDMDAIVVDVSELTSDDILYGFSYRIDDNRKFRFKETVSDVWKALFVGKHVCLSGVFSNELVDHLSTLLLPEGYLWHAGEKKYFTGKLTLMPKYPIASLTWSKQTIMPQQHVQHSVKKHSSVEAETERFPAMMSMLQFNPWVLIEGEPGIGKSCFIRELYKKPELKCFSYNAFDNSGLEAWAKSKDTRMNLLIVDEVFLWGGDRTEFNRLKAKNRIMLINKILHTIDDNKKLVFLGNLINPMPALFDEGFPTLTFVKLSDAFVIKTILKPIFRQIGKEDEAQCFHEQYKLTLPVRGLQDKAISYCARIKYMNTVLSSDSYLITESRLPIFQSILDIVLARHFRQEAPKEAESARYGGKPGCWLEGAPGAGKTELIRSTFKSLGYEEKTIKAMYEDTHDINNKSYYQVPASCNIEALRKHVVFAFKHGVILKVDELDVLLDPQRSSPEQVSRFIAELHSYLMGEDLNNAHPDEDNEGQPGFTLLATGNGTNLRGRAPLSAELRSRLNEHQVDIYPLNECVAILFKKNIGLERKFINSLALQSDMYGLIRQYQQNPKKYTFRSLLDDVKKMSAHHPMPANGMPESHTIVESPFLTTNLYRQRASQVNTNKRSRLNTTVD